MKYYAHIRQMEDGCVLYQTVQEHLEGTAALAERFAAAFGAASQGRIAGLTHDKGKYTDGFQNRLLHQGKRVDHSTAGAVECARMGQIPAAFAVAGHHGGLLELGTRGDGPDSGTLMGRIKRGAPDPVAPEYAREITLPAAEYPDFCNKNILTDFFYVRMLFSCLVDADFLDTEAFMREKRTSGAQPMTELLARLNRYVAPWFPPKNELNCQRCEILSACRERGRREAQGLFTLTVPTGGGKTVASLAFALEHAVAAGMQRIIYVVPYTSIIEQTADVFREILGADQVLEHHSGVLYETGDHATAESISMAQATENWDIPVVVTTAVQFFESLYSNRPAACRKLHHLAKSVIVMDEAQMLPVDHLRPCVHALSELSAHYGASVVLCTATQPALTPIFREFQPELSPRELCPEELAVSPVFRRTTITCAGKLSWEELTKRLSGQHQALCIVNSRAGAQSVYERLSGDGVFHLSTLMHPTHRRRVLAEIRRRLKNGERCLVASTSLIEAGVDVDFPQVFRELAGLDSMLQAAGRCNREGKRPREESIVTVFEAPVAPPPLFLTAIGAARVAMGAYPDLQEPDAIRLYFTELLKLKGENAQDVKDILPVISRGDFPFPWVSEHFQMIDTDTKTVYIPGTDQGPLLEQLRMGWRSRDLFRKLAQYAVSVYPQQFEALNLAGDLEILDDQVAILTNPSLYSEQTGLSLQSDFGKALFI